MNTAESFDELGKIMYKSSKEQVYNTDCSLHDCQEQSSTYGEITFMGMEQIADYADKYHKKNPMKISDPYFVDLGCGVGKFVFYMALYRLYESYGIEMVDQRCNEALNAVETLKLRGFENTDKIHIIHGDILDKKYLSIIKNCGVIFISNLCFPDETQYQLFKILNENLSKNALLFCSKKLTDNKKLKESEKLSSKLRLIGELPIEMSWSQYSRVHIYDKV